MGKRGRETTTGANVTGRRLPVTLLSRSSQHLQLSERLSRPINECWHQSLRFFRGGATKSAPRRPASYLLRIVCSEIPVISATSRMVIS